MFFNGKLPKLAKTATDIAVVGMFMDEKEKGNFQMVPLILSLPESVMETFKMVLSFEPVDKIIWCDLVNSTHRLAKVHIFLSEIMKISCGKFLQRFDDFVYL